VLSINGVEHGHGNMVMAVGGNPIQADGYGMEAFGMVPEWAVPSKPGVPIYADKPNIVHLRLEAYVGGQLASTSLIVYTLEPVPVRPA